MTPLPRFRAVRLLPLLAAASLAACGPHAAPRCAPAEAATAGWRQASAGPVAYAVPPGYRPDGRALRPNRPGEEFASWAAGDSGRAVAASRITVNVAREVAAPDLLAGDSGAAHAQATCTLATGGRAGEVSTAWLDDPTSATGRSYQTVARWQALPDGRSAALFMVAETPAEQARQMAVAASVRIR